MATQPETQTAQAQFEGEYRKEMPTEDIFGLVKVINEASNAQHWNAIRLKKIAEIIDEGWVNLYAVGGNTLILARQSYTEEKSYVRFIPFGSSDAQAKAEQFFAIAERLHYKEEGRKEE